MLLRRGAASAEPAQLVALRRFGLSLGRARQLRSDIVDLLAPHSRDLAAGIWTWPLVWTHEQLAEDERAAFRAAFRRAASDAAARAEVRRCMTDANAALRTTIEIELACQQGRAALDEAQLDDAGVARLARWVEAASVRAVPDGPATGAPSTSSTRTSAAFEDVDRQPDPRAPVRFLEWASGIEAVRDLKTRSIAWLAPQAGEQVLDLGCGLGVEARRMALAVGPTGRVIGGDASRTMVAEAESRASAAGAAPNLTFSVMDAQALPLADASLDAVRIERLLHLLARPDAAIAELWRVLRPGGRVLIVEPAWGTLRVAGLSAEVSARLSERLVGPGDGVHVPTLLRDAGFGQLQVDAQAGMLRGAKEIDGLLDLARWATTQPRVRAREALAAAGDEAWAALTLFLVRAVRPQTASTIA